MLNSSLMKTITLLILFLLSIGKAMANEWKIYASYHNISKAIKTDSRIFVLANGGLFSYDTEDSRVMGYDKTNALSDFGIHDIAYSAAKKKLVVLYENGNIDLLGMDGTRWNLPDIKTKSLGDKTLNELKVVGGEAFISLNAGLAHINLEGGYFINLYTFDSKVTNATLQNGKLYAKTATGVMEGNPSKNLLDKNSWTKVAANIVTFGLTASEKADMEAAMEKVKNIVINSPKQNWSYKLNMIGNRLLVAGGNFYYPEVDYAGTAMKYENGEWSAFDEKEAMWYKTPTTPNTTGWARNKAVSMNSGTTNWQTITATKIRH